MLVTRPEVSISAPAVALVALGTAVLGSMLSAIAVTRLEVLHLRRLRRALDEEVHEVGAAKELDDDLSRLLERYEGALAQRGSRRSKLHEYVAASLYERALSESRKARAEGADEDAAEAPGPTAG